MAERKFGQIYTMSENFEDYSYIINGVGGIGKTTLVHEIGKLKTGSPEGTFIITCGGENKPKHIHKAFGHVAPDVKTFVAIVKELCTNREAYPHTMFVAIDSLDEYARIFEEYVVAEWNSSCEINERAKSIKQAYKGYQAGENRVTSLMIQQIMKLQDAGYSLLLIGHTKTKSKEDVISKVQFEQLTCNLDNKYYNALKDKVNLVAMCYYENVIENIEEKKNAFTKKMDKVGELVDRKRVMVFADDDNAIDCKSHFEYIEAKIDFNAKNFVKAVEDAIVMKIGVINGEIVTPVSASKPESTTVHEYEVNEDDDLDADNTNENNDLGEEAPFDVEDELDIEVEIEFDFEAARTEIRNKNKTGTAEQKQKVKALIAATKMKLDQIEDENVLKEILAVFN